MRIDAVIICVNYADYLRHTLPLNKSLFDKTVIVTSTTDKETQKVCQFYNVEYICTDVFYDKGAKFNKGKGINAGLKHLNPKDWIVNIDADIALPSKTRSVLEQIDLDIQFLYGIDRQMVPNIEYWDRFLDNPLQQHEYSYIHTGPFQIGTRLMKMDQGGYIPLGFFQLFNKQADAIKSDKPIYPEEWNTAASSDLYFSYRWPRKHRHLLPEIIAYHLSSEDRTASPMDVDWSGRRSGKFKHKDILDYQNKLSSSIIADEK